MLDKFEGYIKSKKRNINKKALAIVYFCIFGITIVFLMDSLVKFKKEKELLEDEYARSMYEMIGYIKNVNVQLDKLLISKGNKVIITTLADIWRQSNLAKENLANLPVNQDNMGNASKYLAQLSDYSYFLIEKIASGKNIEDEEYKNLNDLSQYSKKLFNITSKIYDDLNSGRLKWNEVKKVANENLQDSGNVNVYSISKTFQDYAGLIYDGAFSEHILDIKPQMLKGELVTTENAKKKIEEIYGTQNIESLEYVSEIENRLQLYHFKLKLKEEECLKNIYLTKDTGLIYLIISDRNVTSRNITDKKAEEIGKEYLEKLGITSIESTYYYIQDNMITINYAATQDNVIFYPDLIKVKIALDNGEVCSVEAGGYIYNHKDRENLTKAYTVNEAKEMVNGKLNIESVREAVIPTDAKEEIFTYEFKCSLDEKNYIIYINADSLQEEKVLIIIETTQGSLTM